jgi:hypothetical protein
VTLAYCLLVAWLLKRGGTAEAASKVPGIERLAFATALINAQREQPTSSVTERTLMDTSKPKPASGKLIIRTTSSTDLEER